MAGKVQRRHQPTKSPVPPSRCHSPSFVRVYCLSNPTGRSSRVQICAQGSDQVRRLRSHNSTAVTALGYTKLEGSLCNFQFMLIHGILPPAFLKCEGVSRLLYYRSMFLDLSGVAQLFLDKGKGPPHSLRPSQLHSCQRI